MSVEILISCMNENDLSIIKRQNIKSHATIINQTNINGYKEEYIDGNNIKMISCNQKGLSKSRNLALTNASKEICILCDDDLVYEDDAIEIIEKAFKEIPDADIIAFNIERINYDRYVEPIKQIRKSPYYKTYGSVRIAFRLDKIKKNNLWFNINFGSGSIYSSGEESILLREARRKKLNVYEYPATIAKVDFSNSTWRKGYNEKFFYDKGAFLEEAYPLLKYIYLFYYIKTLRKSTKLSNLMIFKWLILGMRGYKNLISYEEYISNKR